tara:strand:- start:1154 stop:1348 length:195 start_codon:yes stop_codon:yes gene_type:complete
MKIDYKKSLKQLKPLRIVESALLDMMDKDENNPEFLPKHYSFICSVIEVLEELKKDIKNVMTPS